MSEKTNNMLLQKNNVEVLYNELLHQSNILQEKMDKNEINNNLSIDSQNIANNSINKLKENIHNIQVNNNEKEGNYLSEIRTLKNDLKLMKNESKENLSRFNLDFGVLKSEYERKERDREERDRGAEGMLGDEQVLRVYV